MTFETLKAYQVPLIFLAFALIEIVFHKFPFRKIPAEETKIDLLTMLLGSAVLGPFVNLVSLALWALIFPSFQDAWKGLAWWAWIPILLLGEDMLQYWWHRSAHTFPILWRLHRAHHSAPYIGVRITYRNGLFYTLLFPNRWVSGLWLFLGGAGPMLIYGIIKGVVTTAAHSSVAWDAPLYKYRILHPIAWLIERIISTPATHWAHHAKFENDGIGIYKGNYGNLLFFWDVIFGTARITRKFPQEFGVPEDDRLGSERWYSQLLYPLTPSHRIAQTKNTLEPDTGLETTT